MHSAPSRFMRQSGESREVKIESESLLLPGDLRLPSSAQGVVIFAHGSGSSHLSPRNQHVARILNQAGLGTLLFDLLTQEEAEDRENVFDIPLLADRLTLATRWLKKQLRQTPPLPIGYFGASTGAGAALWAAAHLGNEIAAVVSRGGRPDLAISKLSQVTAPTLLIVGGFDEPVIEMNQRALKHLKTGRLLVIPGATHLFEEPGKLEVVANHASAWFQHYMEPEHREKELRTKVA